MSPKGSRRLTVRFSGTGGNVCRPGANGVADDGAERTYVPFSSTVLPR